MKIYLTFDIEIWCDGWDALDERFPAAFNNYVYGRSAAGDYALPKTLEIMDRHGIKGVFFVESLFAARFGIDYLVKVVNLIQDAEQEVQLHLHPEWTDEIRPSLFPDKPYKRQHLIYFSRDEQTELINRGLTLLHKAGARKVTAFRAGSFAANSDTLAAVQACGIGIDASLNMCYSFSGQDMRPEGDFYFPRKRHGLQLLPMSVFRDGFGRLRHAQVGACSAREFEEAIENAYDRGHPCFTILSHNFEMLRAGTTMIDRVVVGRFEALCRYLAQHSGQLRTCGLIDATDLATLPSDTELAQVGKIATIQRISGQLFRRLHI